MLQVRNISYKVKSDKQTGYKHILKDVSFEIQKGAFVTLFGRSGCGKSTLLNIISGLLKPSTGEVVIDGVSQNNNTSKLSFVFQESTLFPFLTVRQNVEFGMRLKNVPKQKRRKKSEYILQKVGLYEYRNKYPAKDKLSGGMRQRVEIAGVLADGNDIILMDEPFSALDDLTRSEMQEFLLSIWKEFDKTIVFVTHNKEEAILLSDRLILMSPFDEIQNNDCKQLEVSMGRPRDLNSSTFLDYKKLLTEHLSKKIK